MKSQEQKEIALVNMIKLRKAIARLPASRAQAILDAVIHEESHVEEHVSEKGHSLKHQPS